MKNLIAVLFLAVGMIGCSGNYFYYKGRSDYLKYYKDYPLSSFMKTGKYPEGKLFYFDEPRQRKYIRGILDQKKQEDGK